VIDECSTVGKATSTTLTLDGIVSFVSLSKDSVAGTLLSSRRHRGETVTRPANCRDHHPPVSTTEKVKRIKCLIHFDMITMCISTLSFYSLDLFQHIEMILFIH
jgi:hypothetical protein